MKIQKLIRKVRAKKKGFLRQEHFRQPSLKKKWRRPRGIHSKMKLGKKSKPARVKIGYGTLKKIRGLHPSGLKEVLVKTLKDAEKLDPEKHIVRLSGKLGNKKKKELKEKIKAMKIKIIN